MAVTSYPLIVSGDPLADLRVTAAASDDGAEAAAVEGLPWLFVGSCILGLAIRR